MIGKPEPNPIAGRLLVVGGQCRKVGKTALGVDLIRLTAEVQWTAVKITPYVESGCPVRGRGCGCESFEHTYAIREESSRTGPADSSRFLQAGAERAFWLEAKAGRLADALPALKEAIGKTGNVLIESDSIVRYWRPSCCFMVLDPRRQDFKRSALETSKVADGFVYRSPSGAQEALRLNELGSDRPFQFLQPMGYPVPASLQSFVRQQFGPWDHLRTKKRRILLVDPVWKVEDNVTLSERVG